MTYVNLTLQTPGPGCFPLPTVFPQVVDSKFRCARLQQRLPEKNTQTQENKKTTTPTASIAAIFIFCLFFFSIVQGKFEGPRKVGPPLPYYSHTIPMRVGNHGGYHEGWEPLFNHGLAPLLAIYFYGSAAAQGAGHGR